MIGVIEFKDVQSAAMAVAVGDVTLGARYDVISILDRPGDVEDSARREISFTGKHRMSAADMNFGPRRYGYMPTIHSVLAHPAGRIVDPEFYTLRTFCTEQEFHQYMIDQGLPNWRANGTINVPPPPPETTPHFELQEGEYSIEELLLKAANAAFVSGGDLQDLSGVRLTVGNPQKVSNVALTPEDLRSAAQTIFQSLPSKVFERTVIQQHGHGVTNRLKAAYASGGFEAPNSFSIKVHVTPT